jgi:ketosteroid isomerase-like protein
MTTEQVLKTQREVFYRALLEQDWDVLADLYAEDYMLVRSDGSLLTKKEVLRDLQTGKLVFESIDLTDEKVRIVGSVAILTGLSRTTAERAGATLEFRFRLVAVYVEDGGALRLLHFQSTNF